MNVQQIEFPFFRHSLHYDCLDAQLTQGIPGCPAGIGFFDPSSQRTFPAHREPASSSHGSTTQQSGAKDQFIVWTERVARGRDFRKKQFGYQSPAPELKILFRYLFGKCLTFLHINTDQIHIASIKERVKEFSINAKDPTTSNRRKREKRIAGERDLCIPIYRRLAMSPKLHVGSVPHYAV
jgi:hypothetical protein